MRYRYFGTYSGRTVLCMILVVCIIPSAVSLGGKHIRRSFYGVRKNVTFQGKDVSRMLPEEVKAVVAALAATLSAPPVDAALDGEYGGVLPDMNGYEVDVDATVAKVMGAEDGQAVDPVLNMVPAKITLKDYPEHAIYRGNPVKPQVTFLVNVAWGNEYLTEMLEVLKNEKVRATFFLVGRWVRQNPQMAAAIGADGFELANHGDSDGVSMAALSLEEAREQIARCSETISSVCGAVPAYFSPHRGEVTPTVLKAAALEGSRLVMWTVDTVDWKLPGVEAMLEKVLGGISGGGLILMHPTKQTAEFLRQVIPALRGRGLEPVSLGELLSPKRPAGVVTTIFE